MAKKRPDPRSGWGTFEVLQRESDGGYTRTPFSNTLALSGTLPTQALTKMRMVEEIGWPEAKRVLKDDRGKPLIVKKDDRIWLLKCKPHCWRLYFYVREETKKIIYVHAVCKKENVEDPSEATYARSVADEIQPGGSAITPFEFPAD